MAEITLGKALKIKNRLTGRLAKVQADIQAYNSVPQGQADQVNVPALLKTREELVGALVSLKTAINDANREAQRDIYDLAEKKGTVQFLAGVNTRHGPQPAVYPSTTEVTYVAALKKADVDGLVAGLEKEIDQLQDKLDQFNHAHKIEVDGRTLELAS
jgi:hypothetical protein